MPRRRIRNTPFPHPPDRRRPRGNATNAQRPARRGRRHEEVTASLGVYAERLATDRELFGKLDVKQLEELALESEALIAKARAMAQANSSMPITQPRPAHCRKPR